MGDQLDALQPSFVERAVHVTDSVAAMIAIADRDHRYAQARASAHAVPVPVPSAA